jgi:hypothetical protein
MGRKKTSKDIARPLGVRGHQNRSHLSASHAGGEMFVESANERNTMLALDLDPRTLEIVAQPFTVRLDLPKVYATKQEAIKAEPRSRIKLVDGQPHEERVYTPDFFVEIAHRTPLVVESKSNRNIEDIAGALERRARVLNALGYRYLVVLDTEVNHKGLHVNLVNLRDAKKFRQNNDTKLLLDGVNELASRLGGRFAFGEIKGRISDLSIYLGLVSGVIGCDLRSGHLSVMTELWQADGDLSHLQLLNLEI